MIKGEKTTRKQKFYLLFGNFREIFGECKTPLSKLVLATSADLIQNSDVIPEYFSRKEEHFELRLL